MNHRVPGYTKLQFKQKVEQNKQTKVMTTQTINVAL
jgi:hypothetical protein